MDLVTYKAICRLWRIVGVVTAGTIAYAAAVNHAYKKIKEQNGVIQDELDEIRIKLCMLERKIEKE